MVAADADTRHVENKLCAGVGGEAGGLTKFVGDLDDGLWEGGIR